MKYSTLLIVLFNFLYLSCSSTQNKELSVEEKKAQIYFDQGTNDLVAKEYHKALTNLVRAKELRPDDTKIRTNLGMAYYFRKQHELAITELKEAIDLDKKNTDAKMNIATIYMETGKLKDAEKMYNDILKDLTYSALYRVHYNLAILHLKTGDRKSAFLELDLALKEKEDYCPASYKIGELYTEEYRYLEAKKAFAEATKGTCVNQPEPHYAMALTLINLGKKEEAKLKLNSIIEKFSTTKYKILAQKKITQITNETSTIEEQATSTVETPRF
jgi:Tfp pilus assembly protein PilF